MGYLQNRKVKKGTQKALKEQEIARQVSEQVARLQAQGQQQQSVPPPSDMTGQANLGWLRYYMSKTAIIRENLRYIIIGAVISVVEYIVVGPIFTLSTLLVFGVVLRYYTEKFYHPASVHLLEIRMDQEKQVGFYSWHIAEEIFDHINTDKLVNQIRTNLDGHKHTMYIVSKIDWDEEDPRIPKVIHFSWIHFPAYNFLLKKDTYAIMVDYLNRLIVLNFKQRELMDIHAWAMTKDQTRQRFESLNLAKTGGIAEIREEEDRIVDEITRFEKDNGLLEETLNVPTQPVEQDEE